MNLNNIPTFKIDSYIFDKNNYNLILYLSNLLGKKAESIVSILDQCNFFNNSPEGRLLLAVLHDLHHFSCGNFFIVENGAIKTIALIKSNQIDISELILDRSLSINQIAVSGMDSLSEVKLNLSSLTEVTITHNSNIDLLICDIQNLRKIHLSFNKFTDTKIYNTPNVDELRLINNDGANINISEFRFLKKLTIKNNLEEIVIKNNIFLEELDCSGNKIESLDLSCLPNLKTLNCSGNMIESLYISGLTNLE